MAEKSLTQRLGTAAVGLGMIVQALMPSAASAIECQGDKFYNKRTNEYETCRPLPDVSGCKYLGTKGPLNKVDSIPGAETTVKGYQCGDQTIALYTLSNEKVYGFGIRDGPNDSWFWDYENDGNFEQASKKFTIETDYYK